MQTDHRDRWNTAEFFLSAFVLFIVLVFTYGIFAHAPYAGFQYNPLDGEIMAVYIHNDRVPTVQEGDRLLRVGDVSWEEYYTNTRQPLIKNLQPGESLELVIQRGAEELTIPWTFSGFNSREFDWRFFNIWWMPYIYWIFGTVTLLFMRPRDVLRRLLVAANYLTGLFLIFGSLSGWHLWESSLLLHATAWLILPVYLHLHWIFPKPLRIMPKWTVPVFYGICFLFAVAELFQALPKSLYTLAFLVSLVGSAGLQLIHFIKHPAQRREVGLLGIAIILIIIPFIVFLISGISSRFSYLTFLALPFMPLSYFYVIYRHQMGGLELRANRLISAYAFLIILGSGLLLLIQPAAQLAVSHEAITFLTIILTLLITFFSTMAFPAFQAFVEQRLLGIKLPYQNLQELYSARIAASDSMPKLLSLLDEEVFPSLLVRQFIFLQLLNGNFKTLLARNMPADEMSYASAHELLSRSGKYIPEFIYHEDWMRLILPLQVGSHLIGFWLLGRRDPDDRYAQAEIPILQSLANQTAIALSNILHAEQLRRIYQSGIERYENERMRLALDLHDIVLNELAVLRNDLGEMDASLKFQASYQQITHSLREIVSDLRPPMLIYGLQPAINELTDNLMAKSGDRIKIKVEIQAGQERIPENIELHLFRVVQEACQNALRHGQAKNIRIHGFLLPQQIDLQIEDDGIGFDTDAQLEIDALLSSHHFGLAGMTERARLIAAELNIYSKRDTGTRIHILWKGLKQNVEKV